MIESDGSEYGRQRQVLILSSVFPYPPDRGEKIRVHQIVKSALKYFNVDLIAFTDTSRIVDRLEEYKNHYGLNNLDVVPIGRKLVFFRMIRWLLSREPIIIKCYEDKRMRSIIQKAATKEYDAILFCGQRMALYLHEFDRNKCILDYIDAISMNMEREKECQKSLLRRIYIRININKMKRFEKWLRDAFERKIIISDVDKNWLGLADRDCITIPIYVDLDYFQYQEKSSIEDNIIVYLGNMEYYPNRDAVEYFIKRIWPIILGNMPDTRLRIVGNIDEKARAKFEKAAKVSTTGYVKDIREWLKDAKLMIAPIRVGSGVASKIIQSLASGLPVVCTSIANEGIDGSEENGVFVKDDEREFASIIVEMLRNYDNYETNRIEGRRFIENNFGMKQHAILIKRTIEQAL